MLYESTKPNGSRRPHAVSSAYANDGLHTFAYDPAGNMTTETLNRSDRQTFTYDVDGRVQTADFDAGGSAPTITYTYDPLTGDLVTRKPAGSQGIVYIGGIYEKNLDSGVVTKYYFANGDRIAMKQGSNQYFITTDHLGGTALITSGGGPATMVGRFRYYPFGSLRTQEGTIATDKLFTGQQRESTNNMYHYGARMYDAEIGRFISPDVVVPGPGNPQALNRYSYVLNNPMLYTDPSGYFPCPLCDEIQSGAEAVGGGIADAGGAVFGAGRTVYRTGRGAAVDSWEWSWQRARATYRWSNRTVVDSWMYARRGVAATGRFVADYAVDKGQDVANYSNRASVPYYTLLHPQDTIALAISLGSVGDRRSGAAGYVQYENCEGACWVVSKILGNPPAFAPGYIGFAPGELNDRQFTHENRHGGVQNPVLGPAYLPLVTFESVRSGLTCGFDSKCIHRVSLIERDAKAAETRGLFYIPW